MSSQRPSRGAVLAADQVESILKAAEGAAEQIKADAKREADTLIADAVRDAERQSETIRERAATASEDDRRRAAERMQAAQEAADQVMAEARAVHSELSGFGAALKAQAERILRDVRSSHERMTAELTVAGGSLGTSVPRPARPPSRDAAARPRGDRPAGRGFDGVEVPEWVDP